MILSLRASRPFSSYSLGDRASAGPPGPAAEPLGPREQEEEEGSGDGRDRTAETVTQRRCQVASFKVFKVQEDLGLRSGFDPPDLDRPSR